MNVLLTTAITAGIGGNQCLREADLLRRLAEAAKTHYEARARFLQDNPDLKALWIDALGQADEWERLGKLCKQREAKEQMDV